MVQKLPWKNDVAVLSIFWARPDVFKQSFARIREARPRILLLWQDGPRKNRPDDMGNIMACRKIAENIDWECEVHRNYHSENMGCDPSTHLSHKWAFSIVDKCIILEDDIVPSLSFFPFCIELLNRYEDDKRIDRICGMNLLGTYETGSDYFFARYGSSWGWASWRRVAETWDTEYEFLNDNYAVSLLGQVFNAPKKFQEWQRRCKRYHSEGVAYWEVIVGARTLLQNGLVIYPTKNMICNVGLGANSTHAPGKLEEVGTTRNAFFMNTYEYSFPLKHPRYMMADDRFIQKTSAMMQTSFTSYIGYLFNLSKYKKLIKKIFSNL